MGHGVPPIPPFVGPRFTGAEARDARVLSSRERQAAAEERERREREEIIRSNTGRIGLLEVAAAVLVAAAIVGAYAWWFR